MTRRDWNAIVRAAVAEFAPERQPDGKYQMDAYEPTPPALPLYVARKRRPRRERAIWTPAFTVRNIINVIVILLLAVLLALAPFFAGWTVR